MSSSKKGVERGQSITFRVPSDTPDHLLKQLTALKERERRNFSSKIAQFVMDGVSQSLSKEKETVTIPLPRQLTKEQRNWLKHEHSEALMGSIIHQLLSDPTRAMTLLASLNSNAVNIDEALYLQEETAASVEESSPAPVAERKEENEETMETSSDFDLDDLSLDSLQDDIHSSQESQKEDPEEEDPLGDFLSSMNK
ncbi:hypothetical protein GCM10010954_17920 [Halobacillus andaensis]|uniref:Uncharacterized protein n=1 Tax=Halobacillus andaensis TaxID=1176239 RepID=A0A917B2T8_HALAA|nr:hypothetical protein [Halobacillus andaensis]MBP2004707.1 ribosomal protein L12E/L44/L45/RPP1/RPP2 [Halobacillus andaensis]GGF19616.1 hypothetical protein GCM10010954_17920 [Halobacillus andaensis]